MTCQGGGTYSVFTIVRLQTLCYREVEKMPWQVGEEGRGGRKTCQGGGTYSVVTLQYFCFHVCHPLSYIFFDSFFHSFVPSFPKIKVWLGFRFLLHGSFCSTATL